MQDLLADLVLPGEASMQVMSALETSRELIRHSYHRYEFATVAVTHSLFALEQVLAERLAVDGSGSGSKPETEPLQDLIGRAVDADLIAVELAAEVDRCRVLREDLTHGARTSATLGPIPAIEMVRAVFEAVTVLLRAAPATEAETEAIHPGDRLAGLWDDHQQARFPASFRGVDIGGVELILVDADVADIVQRELTCGLDDDDIAVLWACIADLDRVVPLINEEYCASYFARLRTIANLTAARYIPTAT